MRNYLRYKQALIPFLSAVYCLSALVACADEPLPTQPRPATATAEKTERLFKAVGIIAMNEILPPLDIVAENSEGQVVRISNFADRVVFLNFWTSWCPDCRTEMPSMEKLHRRLKDRPFVMLGVNLREAAATVKTYAKANDISFTNLLDPDGHIGQSFSVRSIPTTFIFNQKGALIGKAIGPRDWDGRKAVALFEHLMDAPDAAPGQAQK